MTITRQTLCRHCGLDIEGTTHDQMPVERITWRDRGGNAHGTDGHVHVPRIEELQELEREAKQARRGLPRIFKPRKPRVQGPVDTRQRLQAATRFFARPVSFDLECPHCGTVYVVRANSAQGKRNWDPWTARFECTTKGCARTYVLGMLAWPVSSAPGVASMPPRDQVPAHRQLIQLRAEGGGWWMADDEALRLKRTETTNLTTEEDRPDVQDQDDDDTDDQG